MMRKSDDEECGVANLKAFIVDTKTWCYDTDDEMEAYYLCSIYPFEIKDVLDKSCFYENQFLRREETNKSIEMAKESMSVQTIRYWCSELTKEGILERDREHKAYSISDKAAGEIRYFAGIFGTEALHHLTANFPISTTL